MNYNKGIKKYEYFICYKFLKDMKNKDPLTLLFFLHFIIGFDSEDSNQILKRISAGENIYDYIKYLL